MGHPARSISFGKDRFDIFTEHCCKRLEGVHGTQQQVLLVVTWSHFHLGHGQRLFVLLTSFLERRNDSCSSHGDHGNNMFVRLVETF